MPRPSPAVPPVPLALVEHLEAVWPDKFPEIQGADAQQIAADLHRQAGRLDVIRFLRTHLERQTKATPPAEATA